MVNVTIIWIPASTTMEVHTVNCNTLSFKCMHCLDPAQRLVVSTHKNQWNYINLACTYQHFSWVAYLVTKDINF